MSQAIDREGRVARAPRPRAPSGYCIRPVEDAMEVRKVLHLRYREYCIRMRSLNPVDYPDQLERDAWDDVAILFAAFHKGRISGCTRLVRPSVEGRYLMERTDSEGEGFELPSNIDRARTLESSRLIAHTIKNDPELGTVRQWFELLGRSCQWSLDHGFTHWVVASQEAFFRARLEEGWPFRVLGEPQLYHNTISRPVMLALPELYSKIFEGRLR